MGCSSKAGIDEPPAIAGTASTPTKSESTLATMISCKNGRYLSGRQAAKKKPAERLSWGAPNHNRPRYPAANVVSEGDAA